ncbi:TPA: hypothetical protein ACV5IO_005666 [Pseudomonas aeruginosa]|uniref:antitoxin VbhA family protein n=1 Tax=Pseudomonas aeruginosa TaxID=287 RepID=UPI0003BB2B4D|nr:antitoxin VbhA family protein [Pseudomonas aeruginosa]ERZ10203.1 hypothetical protein Q007_06458 [Pseudomonas aeruginosa S54485]MCS8265694.1 antitoxin VbhA family protein [Pseudomonas aeruginosa]MCV0921310.1 antitoxin VbhA family protein [Escherichia coli]
MSKETTMTFRVEPDLRAEFHSAAEIDHRPAAQVLREFMRDYVQQVRSRAPAISPAERKRREDAVNYARASVGLEGFKISKAEEQHARRFINGEIEMPEFLKGSRHDAAQER